MLVGLFIAAAASLVSAAPAASHIKEGLNTSSTNRSSVLNATNSFPPANDTFYSKPANLSAYKPGQVVRNRTVKLSSPIDLLSGGSHQVVYRTTNLGGGESWTVATVIAPQFPKKNETKLFSYQFYEDATQINCSPSYSLLLGDKAPDGSTASIDTDLVIIWALLNGYHIVIPDHEGPSSAFFTGEIEGYAGLDGIRAAESFLNISKKTPVGLYGYSGGAHASAWMTELHEKYAPEINIVGAAHGGTPVDAKATVEFLDGKPRSGFVLAAVVGLLNADPKLKEEMVPHMNKTLLKDFKAMEADRTCISAVDKFANKTFHTQLDVDLYTYPPIVSVLKRESLLNNSTASNITVPKFPRYIFHAEADDVIPYKAVQTYVKQQCSRGANIQFVPYKGDNHEVVGGIGLLGALQFIQQAFEDKLPELSCGDSPDDVLGSFLHRIGETYGQLIASGLISLSSITSLL